MTWRLIKFSQPERKTLCEVEFTDGTKQLGYLTIARGWFTDDGRQFSNQSPIKKWRYVSEDKH